MYVLLHWIFILLSWFSTKFKLQCHSPWIFISDCLANTTCIVAITLHIYIPIVPVICQDQQKCQEKVEDQSILMSPQYPANYSEPHKLNYNLTTDNGNGFRITFEDLKVSYCFLTKWRESFTCLWLQIPQSDCCRDNALLFIDAISMSTRRVCGNLTDPIEIRSKQMIVFAKRQNKEVEIAFQLDISGGLLVVVAVVTNFIKPFFSYQRWLIVRFDLAEQGGCFVKGLLNTLSEKKYCWTFLLHFEWNK